MKGIEAFWWGSVRSQWVKRSGRFVQVKGFRSKLLAELWCQRERVEFKEMD